MRRDAAVLALIAAVALAACRAAGVRFESGDLATAWHLLDPELLRHDLARSLFYLHSQPPLLNLIVGVALKLFGANAGGALTVLWSLCAIWLSLSTRALALELGAPRAAAFVAGAAVAIAPATLLYVHHVGPEIATAAALTASAVYVARGRYGAAFALLAVACGLRSLLAPPLVIFALLVIGRRALRPAALAFAALAILALKNGLVVGAFGTSSWLGMNFARVTVARVPPPVRASLSPLAAVTPFAPAGEYLAVIGTEPRGVAALDEPRKRSGATNYNDLVYARASRALMKDDLRAIRLAPGAVAAGWAIAWLQFFHPSDEWPFLAANRARIAGWADLWDRFICLEVPLPYLLGQTSLWIAIAAGVVVFALALRRARGPAMWYSLLLIAWVAVVGNTFDVGENYRFRFLIAPIWAAVAASLARRE